MISKKEQKIINELYLDQLTPTQKEEIKKTKNDLDKCLKKKKCIKEDLGCKYAKCKKESKAHNIATDDEPFIHKLRFNTKKDYKNYNKSYEQYNKCMFKRCSHIDTSNIDTLEDRRKCWSTKCRKYKNKVTKENKKMSMRLKNNIKSLLAKKKKKSKNIKKNQKKSKSKKR